LSLLLSFPTRRSSDLLFGPSGHAKSLAVNAVMTELSQREIHSLLFDWEDVAQEYDRLKRLGADMKYIHIFEMNDGEGWTFASARSEEHTSELQSPDHL